MRCLVLTLTFGLSLISPNSYAHEASARYIANEGLMAQHGDVKILFDPFQVTGFGVYQEPRAEDLTAIIKGQGAFKDIDAVFISHAHRDHFSAPQMLAFLKARPDVRLIAPTQALDMMQADKGWDAALLPRMSLLDMDYGDPPEVVNLLGISATAVRIAHAGWPAEYRKVVQNMVYRITLGEGDDKVTVMHMGDADPQVLHYVPHIKHWDEMATDTAFPPYWFLTKAEGLKILRGIGAKTAIGIHVPIEVPEELAASGADYFGEPGEVREIGE